ncbi:MGDG synthase family glycosyltransferase [Peptostreptococcus canis]|uniref:Glycosyltransferase n=1 Tax=Peptostreptococcus canis TaxID=1159213 RepID=A0ABR6TKB4_9FIRM|nr:glycosyltransferase [Peptostreptococcus canis]MBC2575441.1 glycosyltransferase [Peptostreptococcus canis]MBP1997367.1 UDP-N-acetylglucosamine:LPS N-acetylglucosamine transferase [Peptostreptococcus canis]
MKVLILTARYGMGHISASNSIKQDIIKYNSDAEVKIIDFYNYTFSSLSRYFYDAFSFILKHATKLYGKFYSENDKPGSKYGPVTRILANSAQILVAEEDPDIIISTFPIISQAISLCKKKYGINTPLITCITDISSHYEWISENTDKYLVPCVDSKYELISKGVRSERLSVYGIPVSDVFKKLHSKQVDIMQNEKKLIKIGNYRKRKELLIMGGGLGMLPENESFYKKLNSVTDLHTTIVTGSNRKIYNQLNRKYENIDVLGYTDKISELMENADCVVTKPGGITVFEAIYSLTPVISFDTILPNELNNINFIEDGNFGISLHTSAEKNIDRIIKFINDVEKRENIKKSMIRFVSSLDQEYFKDFLYDIKTINEIDEHRKEVEKIL